MQWKLPGMGRMLLFRAWKVVAVIHKELSLFCTGDSRNVTKPNLYFMQFAQYGIFDIMDNLKQRESFFLSLQKKMYHKNIVR